MAGGRLSLEERRTIASGLAEGLGYAEIGRRLGRPTSTISREVARHGHRRYSAESADAAARHRAPAPSGPGDASTASAATSVSAAAAAAAAPSAAQAFVEEFAALLAATGMPRMASRVFTALLTSPAGSLTAAELVHGLRVSPAAVSKAVGYLDGLDLLRREADAGSRRERYVIDDDVWLRALRTDSSAHDDVAGAATRGIAIFGADSPAGARLGLMGEFFGGLGEQLRGSDLADPVAHDAMTMLAALVEAGHPLGPSELATALGWPEARAGAALALLAGRPELADPLAVHAVDGRYGVGARRDRLTAAQRDALRGDRASGTPASGS
ncbi:helix-turn-helix domain-containing protein [Agromyces sp. MMS24-K17]|uniref:GbsR/MarR family transcriptional regulator n=1 Tax=Agromyces sp. MMS24-K17 TaxID=3372850 RepID=UPI0037547194